MLFISRKQSSVLTVSTSTTAEIPEVKLVPSVEGKLSGTFHGGLYLCLKTHRRTYPSLCEVCRRKCKLAGRR